MVESSFLKIKVENQKQSFMLIDTFWYFNIAIDIKALLWMI